jgi:hypothetical protein
MNKIASVLSQKNYLALFAALFIFFAITLIFAWNLILYANFYVRQDLWTPLNVFLILITAILSALNFTLSVYYLKRNNRKNHGFLSVIPMFFTTACSGCVPVILSFWSATAGVWLAYFADLRFYLAILAIAILFLSLRKLASADPERRDKCPIVSK